MNRRILVVPDHPPLYERLSGRCVVVRTSEINRVGSIAQACEDHGILLHCVWLQLGCALAEVPVRPDWDRIQLAFRVSGMGRFQDLAEKLGWLRTLTVRVYLPAIPAENLTAARILSSLGIETAIEFGDHPPDWERLTDLMTYALMAHAPHANIEPYRTIADGHQPGGTVDFGAAYLDDPEKYLHVDTEGRLALTKADLSAECWASEDFEAVEAAEDLPAYLEYQTRARTHFLAGGGCAYCEAWRVCLGRLADFADDSGCRDYSAETLRMVEQRHSTRSGGLSTWRP